MADLDDLLELAVAGAEIEAGLPPAVVQARSGLPVVCLAMRRGVSSPAKAPQWTEAEDRFLEAHLGVLEEAEIALRLGRSQNSVHLRWTRNLHLPSPSKHPDYLTGSRIARKLGADVHKVCSWIDRGLLEGEIVAGGRKIRRVRKDTLLAWLLQPMNWIWFDWEKIRDPLLRKRVEAARQAWGDEWWTTVQVAACHGVDTCDVLRYIYLGRIQAVQALHKGGRDKGGWGYWYIRKSEATRESLVFKRIGKRKKEA